MLAQLFTILLLIYSFDLDLMINETTISEVRKFAINNSESDDIHGFAHVQRVLSLCSQLGKKLNANLSVLKISTLLHDIGRKNRNVSNKNHAELSAEMASNYLESQNFNISREDFENIVHCIRSHSFSNNSEPHTLEAKILSDVDKLDAIGAIGLYRTIGFTIKNGGDLKQVIEHLETKIITLKNKMFLKESKLIAEKRHHIISLFLSSIKEELKDERDF